MSVYFAKLQVRLESNSSKEQEEYKSWNGFSRMGKEKLARIYPFSP